MYKISDFDFLKEKISFTYKKDIEFYAVAASEDTYPQKMLFYLLDIKYLSILEKHKDNIAGIICPQSIATELENKYDIIITEEPKTLYFLIHNNLKSDEKKETIIEEGCIISDMAYIAPYNVVIKSGTVIEEFVSIKEGTEIGHNCFISSGAKIGTEGFNAFKFNGNNAFVKHRGKVIIGDNVVILSNSCVAKAIYGHINTILEDNAMLDNQVHVAHDCKVCKNAELAAGTTLCGFSEVGENTFMGVNTSIKQLLKVGKNNKVGMGALVNFNTKDNDVIAGPEPCVLEDARLYKHYKKSVINYLKDHPDEIDTLIQKR